MREPRPHRRFRNLDRQADRHGTVGIMREPRRIARIVFIAVASFVGTEFLTGSTPVLPPAWVSPISLLLLALYGSGALLIRELAVIWRKGWLSILAFGAAFGVVEEAIFAKTWFTPMPFTYGRWLGVNWSFGIAEAIVEAVFSIAVPIALARIAFPQSADERWFGEKSLIAVAAVYVAIVLFGFASTLEHYGAPAIQIPFALLLAAALAFVAMRIPPPHARAPLTGMLSWPILLTPVYFVGMAATIVLNPLWMGPEGHFIPAIVGTPLAVAIIALMFRFLHRNNLSDRQLFGAVKGMAAVLMLFTIIGPQAGLGAPIGAALYLLLLMITWWKMKRHERARRDRYPADERRRAAGSR